MIDFVDGFLYEPTNLKGRGAGVERKKFLRVYQLIPLCPESESPDGWLTPLMRVPPKIPSSDTRRPFHLFSEYDLE